MTEQQVNTTDSQADESVSEPLSRPRQLASNLAIQININNCFGSSGSCDTQEEAQHGVIAMQVDEMSGRYDMSMIKEEEMLVSEDDSQDQPLLDTVDNIERPSFLWGPEPSSDDEEQKPRNKPMGKRDSSQCAFYYETAILVNMAMLLFVSAASLSKGVIIGKGVNVASLATYQFMALFLFEQVWTAVKKLVSWCEERMHSSSQDQTPHSQWSGTPRFDNDQSNWSHRHLYLCDEATQQDRPCTRAIKLLVSAICLVVAATALLAAIAILPVTLVLLIVSQGEFVLAFVRRLVCSGQCERPDLIEGVLPAIATALSIGLAFYGIPHQAKLLATSSIDPFSGLPFFESASINLTTDETVTAYESSMYVRGLICAWTGSVALAISQNLKPADKSSGSGLSMLISLGMLAVCYVSYGSGFDFVGKQTT